MGIWFSHLPVEQRLVMVFTLLVKSSTLGEKLVPIQGCQSVMGKTSHIWSLCCRQWFSPPIVCWALNTLQRVVELPKTTYSEWPECGGSTLVHYTCTLMNGNCQTITHWYSWCWVAMPLWRVSTYMNPITRECVKTLTLLWSGRNSSKSTGFPPFITYKHSFSIIACWRCRVFKGIAMV